MDTGYLSQQVTTIINQLHGFFDEIGVPSHERDSRESELFSALSETLHNQLKLVATEKHELTEEAHRLVKSIRQMEAALDDTKQQEDYETDSDAELQITYPLLSCIQTLKEKHQTLGKIHRERYDQIKKLAEALQSYASHLESSFVTIKLPPSSPNAKISTTFDLSPTYVAALDNEFTRVYEEYNKRVVTVQQLAEEIIMLWGELGTPQAQVDSQIVKHARDAPEQLGLHQDDISRMKSRKEKLIQEKRDRERRLKELKQTVEALWNKLGIEEVERKAFTVKNRGCGMRIINEFEDELARLNELKRQNLHLFVEDARFKLQELWDGLYFSEEEMLEFTPAFSDVYSDALLSAHEAEIARLEALKEQRAPTLEMVNKHRSLIKDRDDLAASSQDASRLMLRGQKGEKRDPTRLLREEKMRKRITKELPKVEVDLRNILEAWEDEYGRPFLVHGDRYLDELNNAQRGATQQRSKTPSGNPPPTQSRSKTPGSLAPPAHARSKTPNNPPPAAQPRSAKTLPPASRAGTLRGPPPPRSHTPVSTRNPLAASVRGPPSAVTTNFGASMSIHASSGIPRSPGMSSPSKIPAIPAREPLSNMSHGNNSPERRPRPAILGHNRQDSKSSVRGLMGPPPLAPPLKMKETFIPPTPSPINHMDMSERSASIVRHVDPEDVYNDNESLRSTRPCQSHYASSNYSKPPSEYPTPTSRPVSRFDYPPAAPPPMSRQISNASSVMTTTSAVSGSENWETYTDASGDYEPEPDARPGYYSKMRAIKRDTPEDGHESMIQNSGMGKKTKGYGLGIDGTGLRAIGRSHHAIAEEGGLGVEGSEAGWTDVGETF